MDGDAFMGGGSHVVDKTGAAQQWPASAKLSQWLADNMTVCDGGARQQTSAAVPLLSDIQSAIELGAGQGHLSIALSNLGVRIVVATDGDEETCGLCEANAMASDLCVTQLRWGEDAASSQQRAAALQCGGLDGRCAELLVMADVLYSGTEQADALERTLRALIGAGGCRYVLMCWHERFCSGLAENFLARLEDLTANGEGEARTVWRGWAPRQGEQAWAAGGSQLRGAISLLDLQPLPAPPLVPAVA